MNAAPGRLVPRAGDDGPPHERPEQWRCQRDRERHREAQHALDGEEEQDAAGEAGGPTVSPSVSREAARGLAL